MSAKSDLLSTPPETFVRKLYPTGDYLCQIVEAELFSGYWGTKNRWFQSYVPTIEVLDYVPTGDEDIDAETVAALENFGDWKGFRPPNGSGRWVQSQQVPGFTDRVFCAGIANGLNFILAETTPEWENMTKLADSAARFYASSNSQGRVDGWVVKTLSTDPSTFTPPDIDSATPLAEVIEKTKSCFLIVTLKHEQDEKGEYEPKVACDGTSSV